MSLSHPGNNHQISLIAQFPLSATRETLRDVFQAGAEAIYLDASTMTDQGLALRALRLAISNARAAIADLELTADQPMPRVLAVPPQDWLGVEPLVSLPDWWVLNRQIDAESIQMMVRLFRNNGCEKPTFGTIAGPTPVENINKIIQSTQGVFCERYSLIKKYGNEGAHAIFTQVVSAAHPTYPASDAGKVGPVIANGQILFEDECPPQIIFAYHLAMIAKSGIDAVLLPTLQSCDIKRVAGAKQSLADACKLVSNESRGKR